MADALASGASVLRDVGVQVPLRPPHTPFVNTTKGVFYACLPIFPGLVRIALFGLVLVELSLPARGFYRVNASTNCSTK